MATENKKKSLGALWKKTSAKIAGKREDKDGTYYFMKIYQDLKAGSYVVFPKNKTTDIMPDFEVCDSVRKEE